MGYQNISVSGVPETSHFARTMVAADFRMKRLAMKFIAHKRGKATVTSRDYDLTDYDDFYAFVLGFAAKADKKAPAAAPA